MSMMCANCNNNVSYAVEVDIEETLFAGRTTVWKFLCKKCYLKKKVKP